MESKEIQNRLGENIKHIRKIQKLTQFQLAEKADVSEDTIKSIESGRTWASEKTLSQITKALDVDVYHLFMPVESTFNSTDEIEASIKKAIAGNLQNYVEQALKRIVNN